MTKLFAPVPHAWTARPADPHDAYVAEIISTPPAEHARIGLFGVPFDAAVIGRPGCRFGPDAIRAEMQTLKPWSPEGEIPSGAVAEYGNVRVLHDSIQGTHERVEAAAAHVLEAGHVPVALGGDHSLTYPLVKPHVKNGRKIGVINLDAHLDLRDVHDGRLNSGQSFGRLVDEGLVDGRNLVEVGIRPFANSARYMAKAEKAGVRVIPAGDVHERGPADVMAESVALAADGTDGIYLSVDVDVLDHAAGPGVSAPTPGGVTSLQLLQLIDAACKLADLVGVDFVETAPPLDEGGKTVKAAAYAVTHVLAGLART